jgi:uncharacterized membrane protein
MCEDERMRRAVLVVGIALVVLVMVAPAWAQRTGGSFGGGSVSGGASSSAGRSSGAGMSRGGSSGGSGVGLSGRHGSGVSSSSRGSGCRAGALLDLVLVIAGTALFIGLVHYGQRIVTGRRRESPMGRKLHTSELKLGIDGRARAELQAELARMAGSSDTGSEEGCAALLRSTALVLRRCESSWLYAGYRDLGTRGPVATEHALRRASREARDRFQHELVRNVDGRVDEQEPPELPSPRGDEPGLVVVTLIAAARRTLRGVDDLHDTAGIGAALEDRGTLRASELVFFEVVWSPAAEEDRMTSDELEQLYPDLVLIDPAPGTTDRGSGRQRAG